MARAFVEIIGHPISDGRYLSTASHRSSGMTGRNRRAILNRWSMMRLDRVVSRAAPPAPLPLAGRGRGWGSPSTELVAPPTPTLPRKGGGRRLRQAAMQTRSNLILSRKRKREGTIGGSPLCLSIPRGFHRALQPCIGLDLLQKSAGLDVAHKAVEPFASGFAPLRNRDRHMLLAPIVVQHPRIG